MDLATVIGIFAGFGVLGLAIFTRPGAMFFINIEAVLIVMGGTLAATFVNFPMSDVLGVMKVVKNAFQQRIEAVDKIIDRMVELSRKTRVEGLLSLEKELPSIDNEFLKKGIQLMVDGTDADMLRDILTTELSCLEERHATGQGVFKTMGTFAPAFGMAGTLIGLIQMLQQLQDPTKIGSGMATALVTTFYGVLLANLIFLPLAGKLKERSNQEVFTKQLMIEGICAIQAGDNPRLIRDKLVMFLAPGIRKTIAED